MSPDDRLLLIASLLAAMAIQVATVQGAEPTVSVAKIVDGWQARQERMRSFRFAVTQSSTYAKGAFMGPASPPMENRNGLIVPPETTTYEESYTLLVDGEKMRFTSDLVGSHCEKGIVRSAHTGVFDGQTGGHYGTAPVVPATGQTAAQPTGVIRKGQQNREGSFLVLLPIWLAVRPFHPELGTFKREELLSPQVFRLDPRTMTVNGRQCIRLKELPAPRKWPNSLWLDPQRDFVVMRLTSEERGKVRYQFDVLDYKHEGTDWVPVSWRITEPDFQGGTKTSKAALVKEYLRNPPVDAADFRLEFPPGTMVFDYTQKTPRLHRASGRRETRHETDYEESSGVVNGR